MSQQPLSSALEPIIGLEIHAQLLTRSKAFSAASTAYDAPPNSQACALDLGLPGVLPVLNREAVRMAISFGLAIGARIAKRSIFARKNYFYPDLPKGYQISQYEQPIVYGGQVSIEGDGFRRSIAVTRAHLEEDAGKLIHDRFPGQTAIDLNRAGIALLEIVSEPELKSVEEAVSYMRKIHSITRFIGICDGNMQEGSFRCDANISMRPVGSSELGTRTEIKNLNSFRFVERALKYEIRRQTELLENDQSITQETRLYDAQNDHTRPMRSKENANDYRYFPDPDLLPLVIESSLIEELRAQLPELPDPRRQRFIRDYGLNEHDAHQLTLSSELADYFEATVAATSLGQAKTVANWIIGTLAAALNRASIRIEKAPITPKQLGQLVQRISDQVISGSTAKEVFEKMWMQGIDADEIIHTQQLQQISDQGELSAMIDTVIENNQPQVAQYRAGKTKVLGYLVGQVMKLSRGQASPQQVNALLRVHLDEH